MKKSVKKSTRRTVRRLSLLENKKLMVGILIFAGAMTLSMIIASLIFWAPRVQRTADVIDQNNYTTGKFVEKVHGLFPAYVRRGNVYHSIVSYEYEGKDYTAKTFVWSPRPGRTVLVYVDKNDHTYAVTKSEREQAVIQVSLSLFILIVAIGLGSYLTVKHYKDKRMGRN